MFRPMEKKRKEKKSEYQKLIDLLNEYEDPMVSWYEEYVEEFGIFVLNNGEQGTAEEIIISKNYGFIKWLVENEKIEYRKIIEKEIEVGFKLVRIKDYPNKIMEEDVEELLMLLSIQDEPIEFLVSILK